MADEGEIDGNDVETAQDGTESDVSADNGRETMSEAYEAAKREFGCRPG